MIYIIEMKNMVASAYIIFFVFFSMGLYGQSVSENQTAETQQDLPLHYLIIRGSLAKNYYAFSSLDHTVTASNFSGAFAHDYWFNPRMAVTSELVYLQKKFNGPMVRFHYVCLDILFKVSSARMMYAAIGFGLDFLLFRNHDAEHVHVSRVDISLILVLGFYFNLWIQSIFFNGEIRVRAALNYVEFLSWGKRHIAHASIEFGLAFPLKKK